MVGSKPSQLDPQHQLMDGRDEDAAVPPASEVSCSICLDLVSDRSGRSWAKLQCGHQFHLDCIGSAFNMKGAMQCPNCWKVEKGQWLYANGSTGSLPELTMEEWSVEEYYDPVYSEMQQFRAQWCPFGEFTRVGSSSEEVESPSTTYHEMYGHHAISAEHAAASPVAHSYVAYVGPIPSTTLRNSDSVDDPNFNRHWNILTGHNEIFIPRALPTISIQYHTAAPRSSNGELDAASRPSLFRHPSPFEHGSSSRGGSSFVSSVFHRHPGSGTHTDDRIWPSLAYYRQHHHFHQQCFNRPGVPAPVVVGVRGIAPMTPAAPQPDQSGGFYVYPRSSSSGQNLPEAESSYPNNYLALERDRLSHFRTVTRVTGWGGYYPTSSSGSGNRSGSDL